MSVKHDVGYHDTVGRYEYGQTDDAVVIFREAFTDVPYITVDGVYQVNLTPVGFLLSPSPKAPVAWVATERGGLVFEPGDVA